MAALPVAGVMGYTHAGNIISNTSGPTIVEATTLMSSSNWGNRRWRAYSGSAYIQGLSSLNAFVYRSIASVTNGSTSGGATSWVQDGVFRGAGLKDTSPQGNFGFARRLNQIGIRRFSAGESVSASDVSLGTGALNAEFNLGSSWGWTSNSTTTFHGDWGGTGRGYAGFSPNWRNHNWAGWLDIGWDGNTLRIFDWAYATTGGQISMGEGATAIPGGAGLAALAIGAAGLRRRRKRSA